MYITCMFRLKYRVRRRLFAALSVILVAVIAYIVMVISSNLKAQADAERLEQLLSIAPYFGQTIHEFQKERGMSAGFISSGADVVYRSTLVTQKEQTNKALKEYSIRLNDFRDVSERNDVRQYFVAINNDLAMLNDKRKRVTDLNISINEMADFYTGLINQYLNVLKEISANASNQELFNAAAAYVALLEEKERTGLERAMGNVGFASGRFDVETLQRYKALIAEQNAFHQSFEVFATEDLKTLYHSTITGKDIERMIELRDFILKSPDDLTASGAVGTNEWWDVITTKINLMKTIEDQLVKKLVDNVSMTSSATQRVLWLSLIIAGLIMLLSFVAGYFLIWDTESPVDRLKRKSNELKTLSKEISDQELREHEELIRLQRYMEDN